MNDSISMVKVEVRALLLSDEFKDELLTIQGAFEGLVIPPPELVYTHERVQPPERFPAAELLGLSSTPTSDSSAQIYEHNIDVLWTVVGSDEPTLVRQVEGLVLATRRISWRAVLAMPDGTAASIIPGIENYGPLIARGRGLQPLVKGATIRLRVPTLAGVES